MAVRRHEREPLPRQVVVLAVVVLLAGALGARINDAGPWSRPTVAPPYGSTFGSDGSTPAPTVTPSTTATCRTPVKGQSGICDVTAAHGFVFKRPSPSR